MSRFFPGAVTLLLLLGSLSPLVHADEIVAVVNQNVILKSELDSAYQSVLSSTRDGRAPTEKEVLEELVSQRIQLDLAERLGIYVTEAEVQQRAAEILRGQGLTRQQQLNRLARQGVTYAEWLEDVRDSMRIRQLQLQQLRSYVNVNEDEIDNFLVTNTPPQLAQARYDLAHLAIDREDLEVDAISELRELLEAANTVEEVRLALAASKFAGAQVNAFSGRALGSFPANFASRLVIMSSGEAVAFTADGFRHFIKVIKVDYPQADLLQEYQLSAVSFMGSVIYNDAQVKVRIDDIYAQLLAGRDFFELAAIYFTQNSPLQNYIGSWLVLEQLPPEIAGILAELDAGAYSAPFPYAGGRHIIYLDETRVTDRTLQKWRNNAYQQLANRKVSISLPFWLNDILARSYVEYRI